jgi:hypothetical protein
MISFRVSDGTLQVGQRFGYIFPGFHATCFHDRGSFPYEMYRSDVSTRAEGCRLPAPPIAKYFGALESSAGTLFTEPRAKPGRPATHRAVGQRFQVGPRCRKDPRAPSLHPAQIHHAFAALEPGWRNEFERFLSTLAGRSVGLSAPG